MKQILVVDDSPTMRQLISLSVKGLGGVEVVEAQDGMDALRKLTTQMIDLALVDINMPVLDGLKLISLMRSDPTLEHIPIVVVTTEGGSPEQEKALALGANEYVTKPLKATRLLSVIQGLIR